MVLRRGPLVGLVGQQALLVLLALTTGLAGPGWVAGSLVGLGTALALARGLARAGRRRLGPADQVTLTRAVLTGGVAALVADAFVRPVPLLVLVGLATVSLVLDGVDGRVARRTGTASALGARFDMETDALLVAVLSLHVARDLGPWVLAIGAARYAFVVAGWLLPWLRAPLPPRYWRKVVAVTQAVALLGATTGVLPRPVAAAVVALALLLLAESFGRDTLWLARSAPGRRRSRPAVRPPGRGTRRRPVA